MNSPRRRSRGRAFEREASDAALRHAARTDGLTQLANRTAFNEGIEALERPGESALILVDLDGFKGVNDGFGHAAGDAVLVAFDGFVVEVRASIGVCSPIPMSDSERALRSADDALYEAKRGGRDQVVLAS